MTGLTLLAIFILDLRFWNASQADCIVTVGETDCATVERMPFSSIWFSHKLSHAGLRKEAGVRIYKEIFDAKTEYFPVNHIQTWCFLEIS